jgi:hypothetical protein
MDATIQNSSGQEDLHQLFASCIEENLVKFGEHVFGSELDKNQVLGRIVQMIPLKCKLRDQEVQIGDIVKFWRGTYYHFGSLISLSHSQVSFVP